MKLHKLATSGSVKLGKFIVLTDNVVGKPFWTTYRMEAKKDKKGVFNLVECVPDEDQCQVLMKDVSSGLDNRNILDDGSSQKLSCDEIIGLKDGGLSSKEIVSTLIENSTTFQEKTEYSQEKYLKKKEKKYFEYITIRKPTIRLIADIMYKQDPNNIMGLRSDTLSQLATAVNLHPHGLYIIYESGCQSLASATILNGLSSEGRLILVHPGSNPQKQAIQGLNLSPADEGKLIYVNIYTILRKLRGNKLSSQKESSNQCTENLSEVESLRNNKETPSDTHVTGSNIIKDEVRKTQPPSCQEDAEGGGDLISQTEFSDCSKEQTNQIRNKRKLEEDNPGQAKKPRYEIEADLAASLIREKKADGLIIVCKEHPSNILNAFLPYVGPSRNFVVYGSMREPLQELSMQVRKRPDVIFVQLSEMWLRHYQVMENRTHPCVSMSGGGGYLLTGVVVHSS